MNKTEFLNQIEKELGITDPFCRCANVNDVVKACEVMLYSLEQTNPFEKPECIKQIKCYMSAVYYRLKAANAYSKENYIKALENDYRYIDLFFKEYAKSGLKNATKDEIYALHFFWIFRQMSKEYTSIYPQDFWEYTRANLAVKAAKESLCGADNEEFVFLRGLAELFVDNAKDLNKSAECFHKNVNDFVSNIEKYASPILRHPGVNKKNYTAKDIQEEFSNYFKNDFRKNVKERLNEFGLVLGYPIGFGNCYNRDEIKKDMKTE